MDLEFLWWELLPAQVQTANPILILLFIPLVNYLIYPAIDKVFPLTPLRKIGIGLFLTGFSFVVIAYIQSMIDAGQRPTVWWQFLAYVILTAGETMVSITGARAFLHPGAEQDEERGHGRAGSSASR